jgi:hypothetical protein
MLRKRKRYAPLEKINFNTNGLESPYLETKEELNKKTKENLYPNVKN